MILAALFVYGCDSGNREVDNTPPPSDASQMPSSSGGQESAGGGELKQPDKVMPVKDAEAAYEKAKKAYEGSKDDEKVKGAYVNATLDLANANMFGQDLDSKVKYRAALKYYREVLKVDPGNEQAASAKNTIEEIYRSMGREIPGEGG